MLFSYDIKRKYFSFKHLCAEGKGKKQFLDEQSDFGEEYLDLLPRR